MKRICIFNGYYIPSHNYGGPLTSIKNVVDTCKDYFEFYIVCANHDFNSSDPFDVLTDSWVKVGNANVFYLSDKSIDFSFKRMRAFIASIDPDLIWFTGVLIPRKKIVGTMVAKQLGIPVLFSPRGEVDADRVHIKAYKKIPYLYALKLLGLYSDCYFHSTCRDETEGIIRYFNPPSGNVFEVSNIALSKQKQLALNNKVKGVLRLFFVSRIHPVKNLLYAIDVVSKSRFRVSLDIYGPIEDSEYWSRCQERIASLNDNITITYNGLLSRDELPRVIQEHDCLLFPTVNENYGHVIAESLANTRPIIISRGTTPWDGADNKAGFVIPLEESTRFTEVIDYLASLDNSEYSKLIQSVSDYYDTSDLINSSIVGHIDMFNKVIEKSRDAKNI